MLSSDRTKGNLHQHTIKSKLCSKGVEVAERRNSPLEAETRFSRDSQDIEARRRCRHDVEDDHSSDSHENDNNNNDFDYEYTTSNRGESSPIKKRKLPISISNCDSSITSAQSHRKKAAIAIAGTDDEDDIPIASKSHLRKMAKKKKVCNFCGANETPMWRRGPNGKGTLCNACGVKWSNIQKGGRNTKKKPVLQDRKYFNPLTFMYDNERSHRNESDSTSPDLSQPSSPDHYPSYFQDQRSNRMKALESNKRLDLDFDSSTNMLLSHLLSVVRDRVLEEQEMEEIKKEILNWKKDVYEMVNAHKVSSEECIHKATSQSNWYHEEITRLLVSSNSKISEALQNLQNGTKSIFKEIEQIKVSSNLNAIKDQILQMANKIEKSLEESKSITTDGTFPDGSSPSFQLVNVSILSNLKAKQASLQQNFAKISCENNLFGVQLHNQFLLVENVFTKPQDWKSPI